MKSKDKVSFPTTKMKEETVVTNTSVGETQTNMTNTIRFATYQPGIHSSQTNKQTNKSTNKYILSSSQTFDI
jgi:hypothetical protein